MKFYTDYSTNEDKIHACFISMDQQIRQQEETITPPQFIHFKNLVICLAVAVNGSIKINPPPP